MTKKNPWSQIEIPPELEAEHLAQVEAERKERNKRYSERMSKFLGKDMELDFEPVTTDDHVKQLETHGFTVVDKKSNLLDILEGILNKLPKKKDDDSEKKD